MPLSLRALLPLLTMAVAAGQTLAQAKDAPKSEKPAKPAADPYKVPEGAGPAELLKFITNVQRVRARTLEQHKKMLAAILEASNGILAGKPTDAQETTALSYKLRVLSVLSNSDRNRRDELVKLAEKLKDHKNPQVATLAARELFSSRAIRARSLSKEQRQKLVDDVVKFISEGDLRRKFSVAMTVAQGLERAGATESAADAYRKYAKILGKSKDAQLAAYAAKLEGSARRVTLVGNTMDLRGKTLTGAPFDWSQYRGKVVLVDFWATWCGPCIAELPNVKKNYDLYHDKGFEVVAVSLDRSKEKLQKYVDDKDIPWLQLFEIDSPKHQGWEHPMATYYGVTGIPTVILVDQKGKVVSLNARGPELGKQLQKLLGSPAKKVDSPK